ncbi:MAG: leucine-rich repeat domain-containing protein [Muribaculaceae bacterium]|nr:leucine-rich repeat domain-containing protein [Muribaculaceae bacterium]
MKKILFIFLVVLTASQAARADVVINATNFPDANFRSYMLSEYPSGVITTIQLWTRDSLDLYNKGISDMKGVEYFTNLTYLMCFGNNLTSIDVSANTKLTCLNLGSNKLTSITGLDNCPALEQLYLHYNQLTAVNVVNHSALRLLWVNDNPNLTTLYCYRNALTNLSVYRCTSLKRVQCFENANLTSIGGLANCTAISYLDCEDCSISNLSAVESLPDLAYLYARNNRLNTLNVSNHSKLVYLRVLGNTLLTNLDCSNCALATLNVTDCTGLTELWCYGNSDLTSITGLEGCTALKKLSCYSCALTDLSALNSLSNLTNIICSDNDLTSLSLTYKSNLTQLWVDDNDQLTYLDCGHNNLDNLNVTGCTGLTMLDCSDNASLTSIEGLATCTAMTYFSGEYCALTGSLDMTFCPGLTDLYCYHNNLTGLDVTGLSELKLINCMQNAELPEITGLGDCTKMSYLNCSDCAITSLDLNKLTVLTELWCRNNQLTRLQVATKPNLTTIVASGNSLLEELECNNCALTRLEIYSCPVLYYIDCRNNQLASLSVNSCPDLAYLLCNSNQLTDLDISDNDQIVYLWCNSNQLTSLDLSGCSVDLRSLDCRYNQITGTIDVSRFSQLYQLACSQNQISQLTLGDHPELQDIWCYENQLTSLDASDLPALQTLYCLENQLTSLDVSGCTALETLNCAANQLTSLDVSDCPALSFMNIVYNKLKGSKMGQVVSGLPTRSSDEHGTLYALVDEGYEEEGYTEGNDITVSQVNQANAKYWDVYHYVDNGYVLYPGSTSLAGDVNDDGSVTIADVTALIDYLLSGDATGINLANADVDGSGTVTIADVTSLIDMLLSGSYKMMKPARVSSGSASLRSLVLDKELVLER